VFPRRAVKMERTARHVGKFAGGDRGAHQAGRRVRVGLQDVVPDFVGDRSAQNDPETMVTQAWRAVDPGSGSVINDSLCAEHRGDGNGVRVIEPDEPADAQ
jgi:hypothetical protein